MKKIYLLLSVFVTSLGKSQILLPIQQVKSIVSKPTFSSFIAKNGTSKTINKKYGVFLPSIKNPGIFNAEPTAFLSTNNITYNNDLSNVSMYSELAADYFGPVRGSVGTTLMYPKNDPVSTVQETINREKFIQRFSTGGGCLIINSGFPLYVYNADSKVLNFQIIASPKFSLDAPSFGVSTETFPNNTSLGGDIQLEFVGKKGLISIFGYTRFTYTMGNSTFYDALTLTGNDRKGFPLHTFTLGLTVKDMFSISYQKFFGPSNITEKLKGYLTFIISPNFK